MPSRKLSRGFTLIELVVVIAIIAIISAIALPSYREHVRTARRTAAQGCLIEMAQSMERTYASRMTYAGAGIPNLACSAELNAFYNFSFSAGPAATSFTLQAAPIGAQSGDRCGSMSLDHRGVKAPADPADCWK